MSAEIKIMMHAMEAMDRIFEKPKHVRIERNPLDNCDVCGAEDKFGDFAIDMRNGREIALCRECE